MPNSAPPRSSRLAFAAVVVASCYLAPAALAHDEVVIGQNASGQLVAHVDSHHAVGLEPSIFPGINGFATAIIGFHSAETPDPEHGILPLSPTANIQAILVSHDPGLLVHDGLHIMSVGEAMTFGTPFFDFHPIFNITAGIPGEHFHLHFVFHDLSGAHADSEEVEMEFTVVNPCPADVNGDGVVNAADLALLLGAWGTPGPGDFDGNGTVGSGDIATVLGAWGACP